MEPIYVYENGREICIFGSELIADILHAEVSPQQKSEFNSLMKYLREFSKRQDVIFLDLGEILSDGKITAAKTKALPIVFSALKRCGALSLLSIETIERLTEYTRLYGVSLDITIRNMEALGRLIRAADSAFSDFKSGDLTADEAAEIIIEALPKKKLNLKHTEDLKPLHYMAMASVYIAQRCENYENAGIIYDYLDSISDLLDNYQQSENQETDEND